MFERIFNSAALVAIVLLALAPNMSATDPAQWTLVNQPARLVNGSPVLFRVTTPQPVRTLSGTWLDHQIAFSFDARSKTWFALAGAGQEVKPELIQSNCTPKHPLDSRFHSKRKFAWSASVIRACS